MAEHGWANGVVRLWFLGEEEKIMTHASIPNKAAFQEGYFLLGPFRSRIQNGPFKSTDKKWLSR